MVWGRPVLQLVAQREGRARLDRGRRDERGLRHPYFDDGIATNDPPAHNPGAKFWIPTFDEWFKAAYYKGGSTNAGYWTGPFRADGEPKGGLPTTDPVTGNAYPRWQRSQAAVSREEDARGFVSERAKPVRLSGYGRQRKRVVRVRGDRLHRRPGAPDDGRGLVVVHRSSDRLCPAQPSRPTDIRPRTGGTVFGLRLQRARTRPPVCSITSPNYGRRFTAPTSMTIQAVGFRSGRHGPKGGVLPGVVKLGEVTNAPFVCEWSRRSAGAVLADGPGDRQCGRCGDEPDGRDHGELGSAGTGHVARPGTRTGSGRPTPGSRST